jgi:hypothetical protein
MAYINGKWMCRCGAADYYSCLCRPLAKRTPVEVDTRINELDYRHWALSARWGMAEKTVAERRAPQRQIDAARATLAELDPQIQANRAERRRLEREWKRRRWARAYVVPGGHVHADYHCHTLYVRTVRYLAAVVSGMDEKEVVEAAGERACTVCYPSAPVEARKRASRISTPDEDEAAAERARQEAARAAKNAGALTVELFDDRGKARPATFKTAHAARISAVEEYWWALFGVSPSCVPAEAAARNVDRCRRRMANVAALAAAVADREGRTAEEVRAELAGKAQAKFKRDAKGAMGPGMTATQKREQAQRQVEEALAKLA